MYTANTDMNDINLIYFSASLCLCVSDWSEWEYHDPVGALQRRPPDGQPAHDGGRALIIPAVHLLGRHQYCR